MYINLSNIKIVLDSTVKHIAKVACMAISGSLENGLILVNTDSNTITIYKDRIDFGKCMNPDLNGHSGHIIGNFYKEYGNIVYRFGSNLKCSFFTKTIEYKGILAPTCPDNDVLFSLIYPRFK